MSTALTTDSTVLFDARSSGDGGSGSATNLAGRLIGRVKSYLVTNDLNSASAVNVYVNGQEIAREIPLASVSPFPATERSTSSPQRLFPPRRFTRRLWPSERCLMEPVEISEGEDYVNVCHWILRVNRISRAFNTVEYEVRSGPMRGMGGIVPVEEFSDRVVSRVRPPRERLGVSESET